MKKAILTKSALLISLFVLLSGTTSAYGGSSPFRDLVDLNGKYANAETSVGNGKWTLVMIWATDCVPCKIQKPKVSAFYKEYKDTLADVFGIALDGPSQLKIVNDYITEHQPAFPNFVGDRLMMETNYTNLTGNNLLVTPTYLLFNPSGELKGNSSGEISAAGILNFINNQ